MNREEVYEIEYEIKKEVIIIENEVKDVKYKIDNLLEKINRLVVNGAEQKIKEEEKGGDDVRNIK